MKTRKWILGAGLTVALVATLVIVPTILAQGPGFGRGPGSNGPGMGQPWHQGPMGFGQQQGPWSGNGPMGRRAGSGFGNDQSLIAVAAEVIGIERADLVSALQDGKTIATVAEENDVVPSDIVGAFVETRSAWLAERVEAGFLSQAQAGARIAYMTAQVTNHLTQDWSAGGFGPGNGYMNGPGSGPCGFGGAGQMMQGYGRWGQ